MQVLKETSNRHVIRTLCFIFIHFYIFKKSRFKRETCSNKNLNLGDAVLNPVGRSVTMDTYLSISVSLSLCHISI